MGWGPSGSPWEAGKHPTDVIPNEGYELEQHNQLEEFFEARHSEKKAADGYCGGQGSFIGAVHQ